MKDILQPLFVQFMPFAQKRMGFQKPPRVFLRDDPQNALDPLGKTAYYDPAKMSVTLFTNGRHPKDIMRSLSHELIHHTQNCNGQFHDVGEMGEGYAQNDEHLREMERQAYEEGNLCFRDWEDSIKDTIYNESLQKGAKNKMSLKDWKNNELSTLLTEKWGFSFNLLTESQEDEAADEDTLNEEEEDEKKKEIKSSDTDDLEERRARGRDREGMEPDNRRRPMEEAEEKGKYDDGDGEDEMCDHVPCKGEDKVNEQSDKNSLRQKKRMQGKKTKEKVDVPMPSEKEFDSQLKRTRKRQKMNEVKIRRIIRKLVNEAMAKKGK
tara:strand:+ start:718 stop:1683 length:966 start_codon:yes stop_codon:yes gene_type:complete